MTLLGLSVEIIRVIHHRLNILPITLQNCTNNAQAHGLQADL